MAPIQSGWIKLYRSWFEIIEPTDLSTAILYFYLNSIANISAGEKNGIKVNRGQVLCSLSTIGNALKMSRKSVSRRAKKLSDMGYIVVRFGKEMGQRFTLITINNYNILHDVENNVWPENGHNVDATWTRLGSSVEKNGPPNKNNNNKKKKLAHELSKDNSFVNAGWDDEQNDDKPVVDASELFKIWNDLSADMPKATELTHKRTLQAKARLREKPDLEYWRSVVRKMADSDFCCGRASGSHWRANIDFLLRPDTHIKVLEGKYDNQKPKLEWYETEEGLRGIK